MFFFNFWRTNIDSSVLSTPRRAFGDMKNAFVTPSRSTNCKNTNIIKKIKNDFEVFEEKDETVIFYFFFYSLNFG